MTEVTRESVRPEPAGAAPPWGGRREIVRLAAPIVLGEAVGVVVPLIVMALLGRIDEEALYVRSLYMPLAFLFTALQMGFDVSNQVAAALSQGRERPQDVVPVAASMGRAGAVVWGAVTLLVMVAAQPLAALLEVAPEATGEFVSFLRWVCLANLLFLPTSLVASSLRGYGRPRAAAAIILIGATVEIGGVALLGFGTGLGVLALPVAMAAGGTAALAFGTAALVRTPLWRERGPLTWRPEAVEHLTGVGLPVAVSFLVIAVSNLGLLWVLGPFGPHVVSGFAAAATLESLILVPATALGSATAIIMNRLRGAGRHDLLPRVLTAGLAVSLVAYAVLALAVWLPREPLATLLTGSPPVAAETASFLGIVGLTYACMGLTVMTIIAIEQIGGGFIALLLNVPYFLGTVAVGWLVARSLGAHGLYDTIAVLNVMGVVTAPAVAWLFVRRAAGRGDDAEAPAPA
ncbi:MATE family efflux transporter [Microbispora sp. RL4-1S]|uniref:Probable multidrug resistance protein NorM n=1 Tax=Microbispora oryzae TaxID=2806554 RepID=A0A940WGI6_9ACTN|nr:MATE family efflux transporter [Microbispora oryzae]MBP2702787.1 MATE family efflux transporter [Microbispora oryzae]